MSAKLIYFNFIGTNGVPDSPCAINASQIVYMYTTQTNKTAVVFTNGDLRVSEDTVQSFKSGGLFQGLGEFVSIGTPTRTGSSAWPSANGEVLVNSSYISQLTTTGNSTLVVMNQPSSAPVSFTTTKTQNDIVIESRSNDSPFSFISLDVTQAGGTAPVINSVYSNVGLAQSQVTGTRSAAGIYNIAFPTGTILNNSSIFASAPTGSPVPIVRATVADLANSVQIVTQGTGFTNSDGMLTNTKINILSWPTIGVTPKIGDRRFGGVIFHIDKPTNTAYVLYEASLDSSIVWSTPSNISVAGVNTSVTASTEISSSASNTNLIATACTGVGAAVSALALSVVVSGFTYDDWVMPSSKALLAIYQNLQYGSGDPFNIASYVPNGSAVWASNQFGATQGVILTFNATTAVQSLASKGNGNSALAVRAQKF